MSKDTGYIHCHSCTHEFEIEYTDLVPEFVDGMEACENDAMGDFVFDVAHTDGFGNDCDNRFLTVQRLNLDNLIVIENPEK